MRIIDCSKDSHLAPARSFPTADGGLETPLAVEHGMDVYINERLAMRLTCTPEHLDELTAGRLLTEGIIRQTEDIQEIYICERGLRAKVLLEADAAARLTEAKAETVGTCCTDNRVLLSGRGEAFAPLAPVDWERQWLLDIWRRMGTEEPLYGLTHAAHACYLARGGQVLCCREDIGRHNALDKAIGWALLRGEDVSQCLLFTTGRLPADMVSKAIRAGVPLLASKTYPTDRGVALARQARLTLATVRPGGNILVWTDGRREQAEGEDN